MMKIGILALIMVFSVSAYGQKKKSAARNRLKTMIVYELSEKNKNIKDSETKFDIQGNIVEEIEYEDGKVKKHLKYEYDGDSNKTRETELDNAGKAMKTTEFRYDDDGRKTKEIELNSFGKASKTTEYKYDGDLKTEKIVYDANNKTRSRKTYQYQTY